MVGGSKTAHPSHLTPVLNRLAAAGIDMAPSRTSPTISARIKKAQIVALSKFPGIEVFESRPMQVHAVTQNLSVKNANPGIVADRYWVSPSYFDAASYSSGGAHRGC